MRRCVDCQARYATSDATCHRCGSVPKEIAGFPAYAPSLAHAGGGYDADLFATMAALEANSFWFRSRNELITWAIEQFHPDPTSILEIGCGTGYVLSGMAARFPDAALHGSEIFVEGLGFAKERLPAAELMQMDARDIPYEEEFDVIGSFDVLEHIEEDEAVLAQMHRALRPGGLLVVSVPQHRWLWSPADDHAHHVRRYSARELHGKVAAAGFEVLRATSFVSLLLPLMALSRWRSRRSPEDYDPAQEMQLSPLLDRLLGRVMAFERFLIRRGVTFPTGGSRLVVARRP